MTIYRVFEGAELRLSPDESAYIINLTGDEAKEVVAITEENTAQSVFETSVSCIGASICQVGLRDSQSLLRACVEAVKKADIKGKCTSTNSYFRLSIFLWYTPNWCFRL